MSTQQVLGVSRPPVVSGGDDDCKMEESPISVGAVLGQTPLVGDGYTMGPRFVRVETYESPFSERYASKEMRALFSPQMKFSTWRKIWVALAEAEMELGLNITQEQIDEMKGQVENIDLKRADEIEKKTDHDVIAHVKTYGEVCPKAKGIIHLGATSCIVTDNADVIVIREALKLVEKKLVLLLREMMVQADRYKDLPCLSYTHLQPAQPTTMGKRFAMWMQELWLGLDDLRTRIDKLSFLGVKGATGTQASFLELFDGDKSKVKALEDKVLYKMGFNREQLFTVTGQTYPRAQDMQVCNCLALIAGAAQKMATDIRILASKKEMEEPFGKDQVGSSAMPYKRNPMKSERICSLARQVLSCSQTMSTNASAQWLERTLDDSANRRLAIPEAFMSTDMILDLLIKITKDCVIYPKMIEKNLKAEFPFMATENILMAAVKKGGDRQKIHEQLRQHSQAAGDRVKLEGKENNLLELILGDPIIGLSWAEIVDTLDVKKFVGMAPDQVTDFLEKMAPKVRFTG